MIYKKTQFKTISQNEHVIFSPRDTYHDILKLQWRTKILGTVMENLAFSSLTYQMIRCSVICTFLTTWILRTALPFPL